MHVVAQRNHRIQFITTGAFSSAFMLHEPSKRLCADACSASRAEKAVKEMFAENMKAEGRRVVF